MKKIIYIYAFIITLISIFLVLYKNEKKVDISQKKTEDRDTVTSTKKYWKANAYTESFKQLNNRKGRVLQSIKVFYYDESKKKRVEADPYNGDFFIVKPSNIDIELVVNTENVKNKGGIGIEIHELQSLENGNSNVDFSRVNYEKGFWVLNDVIYGHPVKLKERKNKIIIKNYYYKPEYSCLFKKHGFRIFVCYSSFKHQDEYLFREFLYPI